jgi:hypothetical protein
LGDAGIGWSTRWGIPREPQPACRLELEPGTPLAAALALISLIPGIPCLSEVYTW